MATDTASIADAVRNAGLRVTMPSIYWAIGDLEVWVTFSSIRQFWTLVAKHLDRG